MRKPPSGSSSTTPCCSKVGIKRGPWTPEEDEILGSFVRREGEGQWRTLPKKAGLLRCGKSCRLRWMNYLRPCVKRGRIAPDEEDLILRLHRLLGNRWSLIAGRIPGRTDNEIKNYWNTHLSKKLINQGIDPRTHKPLNPNFSTANAASANYCTSAVAYSNPNPNCPNPNDYQKYYSSRSKETDRSQNLKADRGTKNKDGISNIGINCGNEMESINMEDTFSSFLNSLMNDDTGGLGNQELQVQPNKNEDGGVLHEPPNTPSLIGQGWDYGGLWGPEFRYAMDTLGDENHHQSDYNTYNCNL